MNKQPLLIQDAYDFGPPPPKSSEALWEKLYRFFFGDDVFISYSRADAIRYVPGLAARLAAKGHICFFDQLSADPSEGLPDRLTKKILRSTVFVLVGTKGAMASSYVRKEVELFRRTRRPFIPVDVDGALVEQEGWREVVGVAKVREEGARVRGGDPSPEVVNLIKDSFRYTRRSQWLRASLLAGVSVILITAAASLLVIRAAQADADAIRQRAESDMAAAKKEADEARQSAQNFRAEAERAQGDADDARNRAQSATAAAAVAATRQEAAERSMRSAQELERQSAERAADTARREAGSRAALLSREPGRETNALTLAIQTAEESLAHDGTLPDEVMDGITAAADAADYSLLLEDVGARNRLRPRISPDGNIISENLSDYRADTTRLLFWDGRTGKLLSDISVNDGTVGMPYFSRDGKRFVTTSLHSGVTVWDATGARPRPLESRCGDDLPFIFAALDSDGSHLILSVLSDDRTSQHVVVCEVATGQTEEIPTIFRELHRIAFTPEDEPAAYGKTDGPGAADLPLAVYFLRSGRKVVPVSPSEADATEFVGFGDDGSVILIVKDYDAREGDRVYLQGTDGDVRLLAGYRGEVSSAAFVDGRARVVTVSARAARIADARSFPNFVALRAHTRPLDEVTFSPDDRTLLTVDESGQGRFWDVETGRLLRTINIIDPSPEGDQSDSSGLNDAVFLADGTRLVTASRKGEIQTWDVETGRPICPAPGKSANPQERLYRVSFLAGGDYIAAAYSYTSELAAARFINFLDARTCRPVGTFKFDEQILFLSFSRDGTAMLTATADDPVTWDNAEFKIWSLDGLDLRSGATVRLSSSSLGGPPGPLRDITFDGRPVQFVSSDETGQLWVWGMNSPVPLKRRRGDRMGPYRSVLSRDGTRVAAIWPEEAQVWDARTGKLLVAFKCESGVNSYRPVALSGDGSKLVIADRNHMVRIYPTSREDFLVVARRLLGR